MQGVKNRTRPDNERLVMDQCELLKIYLRVVQQTFIV